MGMMFEVAAAAMAKKLEMVLYKAMSEEETVQFFCKTWIYPLYLEELSEAWGKGNPDVIDFFKNKFVIS